MITGQRIVLLPIETGDLGRTRTWANDLELQDMILRVLPVTELDQQEWHRRLSQDPGRIVFAVKTKSDMRHIGNTGLYNIDWLHRRGEFWCLLGERKDWGQGYGPELLGLMIDFGFYRLNLHKIFLHVSADNPRAIKMYRRYGFHEDGRLRAHYFINGEYCDVLSMSILREEHERQK